MSMNEEIATYFGKLKQALDLFDQAALVELVQMMLAAYKQRSTIFVCGNGGSASTASHLACDINKGVSYGLESRFRVVALTDNMPTITAYANDICYEMIFIEQLKNFITDGDLVIGFSGSGNSSNVLRAIEYANSCGNSTIGITGYDGGRLRQICKHSVHVNINDMQITEDIHLVICHLLMKLLHKALRSGDPCCN